MGNSIGDQVGGQADVVGWEDGKGSENQGKQVRARAPSGPASPRRRWHPCPAAAAPPPCGHFAPPCTDLWCHPAEAGGMRGAGGVETRSGTCRVAAPAVGVNGASDHACRPGQGYLLRDDCAGQLRGEMLHSSARYEKQMISWSEAVRECI
jgi:hypothetical protein